MILTTRQSASIAPGLGFYSGDDVEEANSLEIISQKSEKKHPDSHINISKYVRDPI